MLVVLAALVALGITAASAQAKTNAYLTTLTGTETPAEEFSAPCGVATDPAGYLYVASYFTNEIAVFNPAHKYVTSIEDLAGPCQLSVDSEGNVYVDDLGATGGGHGPGIRLFAPNSYPPTASTSYAGTLLTEEPEFSSSETLKGVAVNPANDQVYIATTNKLYSLKSAAEGSDVISKNEQPGGLTGGEAIRLESIDIDGITGNIYLATEAAFGGARAITILNPAGTAVVETITPPGAEEFSAINAIAVDQENGNVYVSQIAGKGPEQGFVEQFDSSGQLLDKIGPTFGSGLSFIDSEPSSLAVDKSSGATAGHVYVGSGGSGNSAVYEFSQFAEFFSLEVELLGDGTGSVTSTDGLSCPSECSREFAEGEEVELEATADTGSTFAGWGGACSGSGACKVTIGAATTVSATFEANPPPGEKRTLDVAKAGTGAGTVNSSPAGIDCGSSCSASFSVGQQVTLNAAAAAGSAFVGWGGACTGTGSCIVTMDAAKSVTATFDAVLPPPPPPPTETPPGELVIGAKATVRSGKAALKASCTGGGACNGSLKLLAKIKTGKKKAKTKTVSSTTFSVAANGTTTLTVKLSGVANSVLTDGRTLKVTVSGSGVKSGSVKLKSAGKK